MEIKPKIERNIPIPRSLTSKYPLEYMEIGDSFLAHDKKEQYKQTNIASSIRQWAIRHGDGMKFTVRQVDEGIRVWRTK